MSHKVSEIKGRMNRCGGPHHHFFGGGRGVSMGVALGLSLVVVAAVAAALRLSVAVFRALVSEHGGLSGMTLANAAHAAPLPAA
jgi:hypothetical protein